IIENLNNSRSTLNQSFDFGDQKIANLRGKWRLVGSGKDDITFGDGTRVGEFLRLVGNMEGFGGMENGEEDYIELYVDQELKGYKKDVGIDQITATTSEGSNDDDVFKNMSFDVDLATGSITGAMYKDRLNFGAVDLKNLGIEIKIDGEGWYFYSGAGIDIPSLVPLHPLIFPLGIGLLIGDYNNISPSLESRVTQQSFAGRLPSIYREEGIHGFFLTGKKDILRPNSIEIPFVIVDFEMGASVGLDARLYATFGDESSEIGFGAMALGEAYAKL